MTVEVELVTFKPSKLPTQGPTGVNDEKKGCKRRSRNPKIGTPPRGSPETEEELEEAGSSCHQCNASPIQNDNMILKHEFIETPTRSVKVFTMSILLGRIN